VAEVLIVDDDPDIRTMLALALEDYGFSVRTAQDGAAGLAALTEHAPGPAALAAATGWLAAEATRRGLAADEVHRWRTTTLLGAFALDSSWRQVGYTPVVVQWRHGRLDPL
jgi:CheY-like chemotaxis protein